MTEQELDNAAEGFAKSYAASMASGTADEMNYLATFVKAGYKAGYNAALAGYDPYGEYFKKESEEEIIDEKFEV